MAGRAEVYFTQTRVGALVNMRKRRICDILKENVIQSKSTDTIFLSRRVNLSSTVHTGKSVEPARGHKSQLDGHSCKHLTAQCIYI